MILPLEELLVLDWICCAQGEKASGQIRDDLMRWTDLRERVWKAVLLSKLSTTPSRRPRPRGCAQSP